MMLSLSFVGGGPNPRRECPYPLADLNRGGPYPLEDLDRGIQILWGPNPLGHRNVEVVLKL